MLSTASPSLFKLLPLEGGVFQQFFLIVIPIKIQCYRQTLYLLMCCMYSCSIMFKKKKNPPVFASFHPKNLYLPVGGDTFPIQNACCFSSSQNILMYRDFFFFLSFCIISPDLHLEMLQLYDSREGTFLCSFLKEHGGQKEMRINQPLLSKELRF